jgi:signal transduction protein with GAF and PtsI domain
MDETIVATPESEVIDQAETTVEETQQTIEELNAVEEQEKPEIRTVPEHVFVEQKKALKQAEKEIKALKESITNGATRKEIASDIDSIADKYDVDKDFLEDLSSTIKKGFEEELSAKQIAEQKAQKFEKAFDNAYTEALDRGPEFKDIANPNVIKQLALLPQNAKKTLSQILEDTYGNALTGKRTIETTKPGGGKDPEPLDINRASRDTEYFKEVMADPKKKAQYNEAMLKKGF